MCREYTLPRSDGDLQLVCALRDNVRIGPVLEAATTCSAGAHSMKVLYHRKFHSESLRGVGSAAHEIVGAFFFSFAVAPQASKAVGHVGS